MGIRAWRKERVRAWAPFLNEKRGDGPDQPFWTRFYIRFTPNFGLGLPWFGRSRLRIAWHHGVQWVTWRHDRWYVQRQVIGRSRVRGENYGSVRSS